MQMRRKKLLVGLICLVLMVTEILPVGFSVSASELEQPSLTLETDEDAEENLQETRVSESELSTDDVSLSDDISLSEDVIAEETENATEIEETQDEAQTEELVEESTQDEVQVQQELSEPEESTESETEIESETESKSDSQMLVEQGELEGVYQFGDYPEDNDEIADYSVNFFNAANPSTLSKLEEYLYQQIKAKNQAIDVSSYQISKDAIGDILSDVLNENPDLYFVNKNYEYSYSSSNRLVNEVILSFDYSQNDEAFKKAVKEALTVVKPGMSELEKAVALHDYLVLNCEYDKENLDKGIWAIPQVSHSAYGALVNRVAVCDGYALAYQHLLDQVGINCYYVESYKMSHAWNLVELNGKYYQVDVTWDDPTWDWIGRVGHTYMFRSDNDFVNKCRHSDWSVWKGSKKVDYKATDTRYDNAFWLNCISPLVLVGKDCYYTKYDSTKKKGVIKKTTLSDITGTGESIYDIGQWTYWGETSYYSNVFSGLFQANNRLYFNDKSSIYSISLDSTESDMDKRTEFTANTTNGYIYGSAFCQGKVLYTLRQKPSASSKDTVLTANIKIVPVETVSLDKENLILVAGGSANTATLRAVVTPNDATDTVKWKSSNTSVATVNNGKVTAVGDGTCTITATAGGIKAVCMVRVFGNTIANGTYKDIIWIIDSNGKLIVTGTGDFKESGSNSPWYPYRNSVKSAEIDVTGAVDVSGMFAGCKNLETINFSNFDTSSVTDMRSMFSGCTGLKSLDVSRFDTGNVTDMSYMFANCSGLDSLDVSKFDTGNVTNMNGMFFWCTGIKSLDVSKFDTGNVTDMSRMFCNCSGLDSLDVSSFDTRNVADMNSMFFWCTGIKSLDVSKFDTSNVTDMSSMFDGCGSLTGIDVSGFDTKKVTNMEGMFQGCSSLTGIDLNGFDTKYVTAMSYMFDGCSSLTGIDVSGFDTRNVKYMDSMFSGCSGLTSIDVSSFDTVNVRAMDSMFSGCSSLTSIDVSSFDTGNVEYMNSMFEKCNRLTSIDVTGFDVRNVENMSDMFADCSKLTSLDLSDFDLSSLERKNGDEVEEVEKQVSGLLDGCISLATIHTPCKLSQSVSLPKTETGDVWYQSNQTAITELPQNLEYSIIITKNSVPSISEPYLTVKKTQTVYECGDVLSLSDLKVMYHDVDGSVREVTDFDTNIEDIDMSTVGTQTLKITYHDLEAEIKLNVKQYVADGSYEGITWILDRKGKLTIKGTGDFAGPYTGDTYDSSSVYRAPWYAYKSSIRSAEINVTGMTDVSYMFAGCTRLTSLDLSGLDVSQVINMRDLFLGICWESDSGTIYTPCNVTDTVDLSDLGGYWYQADGTEITELPKNLPYSILIAKYTVPTVSDPHIVADKAKTVYTCGDTLNVDDLTVRYYDTDGTVKVVTDYTTDAENIDMSKAGVKTLIITYSGLTVAIKLTVKVKTYTVTFDLGGHGAAIAPLTDVIEGSPIAEPKSPEAKGYEFMGWYKDESCTVLWDFETDTVQSDTTLYASWRTRGTLLNDIGTQIAVVKTKVYDGEAYEPVVKVTATVGGKRTTLTEGIDYCVRYEDNIDAGIGKITVTGMDIYEGEITQNFTISKKPVKKLKILTGGITGNVTVNDLSDLPVYVYDGAKRLSYGTDYTLSGFSAVKANAVQVTVMGTQTSNYEGMVTAKFTVYEGGMPLGVTLTPENAETEGYAYTGKAVKPTVSVKANGSELGIADYKVQYQNNINAGTAYVIVTGKGAYKGKTVVPFTINAETIASANDFIIKDIKAKTYNGKLQKPSVSVSIIKNGKTKKLSKKDYTVTYKNNLHAGQTGEEDATVIITGKGNYAGLSATKTFMINPQQIKKASLKGTQDNLTLTYNKKKLKEGIDYEIQYGTVYGSKIEVIVIGKGDFAGMMIKKVNMR